MSRRGHKKSNHVRSNFLPVEQWPEADQALWRRARHSGNVLEPGGRAAKWAARTVKNVEEVYGKWLKWLRDHHNTSLDGSPTDRVTRERVKLYAQHLGATLAPFTVQMHLQRLGQMMVAFTETKEFGWLFLAANRLRPASVRNKLAKIRPSYAIADVGMQLMQQAEHMAPGWHRPPALVFRDGLIVALLAYRPVRLGNLANIRIGEHLVEAGDGYKISFSAEETKQGKSLSFDLPQSLVPHVRRYIEVYRPALIAAGWHGASSGHLLWISRDGGPLTSSAITELVKRRTKAAFGAAINPHLFRDCAATTIATDEPGRAHAIPGVLGHSSPATSERHYNQARMTEAAERYHHVIEKHRRRKPRAA